MARCGDQLSRANLRIVVSALCLAAISAVPACAQTINANSLALRSNGSASGADWRLTDNGYVGTYINLAAPGNVTINVQASGEGSGGPASRMNVVIGDTRASFDVAAGFNGYQHTFSLPAGTHFIRTEYANDFVNNSISPSSRSLTVRNLSVSGATISNSNSESNALATADTYIQYGRRGDARVALVGAAPGSQVDVQLKRHAFNWGANSHGTSTALFSNTQYTDFFKRHFNMIVPSRAGKWNNNEATRDTVTSVTSGYVDTMLDFAEANGMRARMHNLIWANDDGAEQPSWARAMLDNPMSIDAASGKQNIDALRDEISERIDYYIGDGPGGRPELSQRYQEVDIYNESWHTGVNTAESDANYWDRYGAAGVAGIYEEAAQAAALAGGNAKVYINEYNVFNWGDAYANWYREHIELQQNADGDPTDGPIQGIGIQSYNGTGGGAVNPVRMQQAMQNLSVLGLPMSLTESGVSVDTDPASAKEQINELVRMVFGHPEMTTFMYWGFWGGGSGNAQLASILANADWSLTDIGKMYQDMLGIQDWDGNLANGWTTNLSLPVGPDGTIDFTGFYGDYDITVGGETFSLDLSKGDTLYSIVLAPGDYNGDGTVDAADYTVWRDSVGSVSDLRADGNGDELIDEADYAIWKSYFGATYSLGSGATANVPEPASAVLLIAGAAVALLPGRATRRSSLCRRSESSRARRA
jgi:GH35 family endo-1,4-beta-xylanase